MNLHGTVRGAITSVNPDIQAAYYQNQGYTVSNGRQAPSYASPVNIRVQVQPITTGDIRRFEFLSQQGIYRAVYCFGSIDALVRVENKGGDLLQFPRSAAGASETWLISAVDEAWPGWCRVICTLQTAAPNS